MAYKNKIEIQCITYTFDSMPLAIHCSTITLADVTTMKIFFSMAIVVAVGGGGRVAAAYAAAATAAATTI